MHKDIANGIVTRNGWLSYQSVDFQRRVLEQAVVQRFEANETVYRLGDPLGGIYGLLSGLVSLSTAPSGTSPKLVQLGIPGAWTGEGCFLTRQPRRIELVALVDTWMMHVPLSAMDRICENDPAAVRSFAQILMASTDVLIRIVSDLQKPETAKRIASVLQRMAWSGPGPIPLSQSQLGMMANASRKQVNAALQSFEKSGWLKRSYRAVSILDPGALLRFAEQDH